MGGTYERARVCASPWKLDGPHCRCCATQDPRLRLLLSKREYSGAAALMQTVVQVAGVQRQ